LVLKKVDIIFDGELDANPVATQAPSRFKKLKARNYQKVRI